MGANDEPAERLSHRLMTQTDAEQRDFSGEMADHGERDPRLVGRAGAGRKHDAFRREPFDLLDRDPVVAGDSISRATGRSANSPRYWTRL